jgi:molybdopterin converting factor small subunit
MQDPKDVQIQKLIEENEYLCKVIKELREEITGLKKLLNEERSLRRYVNCRNQVFYENQLIL